MEPSNVLKEAELLVQRELGKDSSGHDSWHIYRVVRTAKVIAEQEGADSFVCQLAAWLHDLADDKLVENEQTAINGLKEWMEEQGVGEETAGHVLDIIANLSFKGGKRPPMRTLEGKVVQDADRLDALGAIGIARTFAYSGAKGRSMHEPGRKPRIGMSEEEYRNGNDTAILHFYEKLLLLKERMNTSYARDLAEKRHRFMERFLEQFYAEWEGER